MWRQRIAGASEVAARSAVHPKYFTETDIEEIGAKDVFEDVTGLMSEFNLSICLLSIFSLVFLSQGCVQNCLSWPYVQLEDRMIEFPSV